MKNYCAPRKMKVYQVKKAKTYIFLQTVHSKQVNRALKRKELLKRKKREEYCRSERERSTPQLLDQDTKHHSMNDFTQHTAKAAVVLLGGRSLPQTDLARINS